jgi:3-oxoacyl-[acyl-carrier-protein] synthase II
MALEKGKLFAPSGSSDGGDTPHPLSQIVVTSVGAWRGEGLGLVERIN